MGGVGFRFANRLGFSTLDKVDNVNKNHWHDGRDTIQQKRKRRKQEKNNRKKRTKE